MKHLTEQKLILVLIAGCMLFLLYHYFAIPAVENVPETVSLEETTESSYFHPSLQERVIYTCRLDNEEIPAVQISEVRSENGQTKSTIARAAARSGIEVTAIGVAPVWDYKAISARSRENLIEVTFDPRNKKEEDDWLLTLSDENTYFRKRVRDCQEVSDE